VNIPADEDVRAVVLAAYRDQIRWMVEGRTDRLAELLADNYTAIHIDGYQQDKAEWLDQIDSGRMSYDAVREESAVVEIKGETAVLTAQALVTATIYGARGTWPLKSVTRYVRGDGTWKPLHSRATTC
jgi:Domain of unknown function (DUF4440)